MRMDSELFTNNYSWIWRRTTAPADWRAKVAQIRREATSELLRSSSSRGFEAPSSSSNKFFGTRFQVEPKASVSIDLKVGGVN